MTYWLPAVIWVTVMLVMSSLPDPGSVLGPGLQVGDPNAHAIGFFVLMLLWARLAVYLAGAFGLRPVVWALAACLIYAIVDELHQIPIPGRSFAWADVVADALGAGVGALVALAVGRWRARATAD